MMLGLAPLGLTALGWLVLIPATACWPIASVLVYLVWRSARRHDASEAQAADTSDSGTD